MPASASPRYARVTEVFGPFDQVEAPDNVHAGDLLIAFVTSVGEVGDLDIGGGNPWTVEAESSDVGYSTRVFTQVAGTNNPRSYGVEMGFGDAGMVALLHVRGATPNGMVIVTDSGGDNPSSGIPAPEAEPGMAGGIEIRYAIAFADGFLRFRNDQFPIEDSNTNDFGDSAYVGAQTMLTSSDLAVRRVRPSSGAFIIVWQAWTLAIPPGDYVPPPPPLPAFTPAVGSALMRYTAHDFMSGTYIDDLYPQEVTYDKRINEPGQFTGTLPVPNSRVAQAIRRVIPKLRTDLTTGPGRVEIRVWRDGVLWGRYWLTAARLARSRDGKFTVQLRASTLDAYWYSVRIRDTREYTGDQVSNVRSLLQHAQTRTGAFNGIAFQTGTSDVDRDLTVTKENSTTYGRAAAEFARTDDGFEYTLHESIGPDGVVSTWVYGDPVLGTETVHTFTESPSGGEIAEWAIDIDALAGGTDWEAKGGTPEDTDATEARVPVYSGLVTTTHRTVGGWPRIDHLINDPSQSTSTGRLTKFAVYWARKAGGAIWVRSVTVFLGQHPSLNMNSLGDYARFLMTNVWYERSEGGAGLDIRERIIGISIKPTQKGRGKEEATLILESLEVPS